MPVSRRAEGQVELRKSPSSAGLEGRSTSSLDCLLIGGSGSLGTVTAALTLVTGATVGMDGNGGGLTTGGVLAIP